MFQPVTKFLVSLLSKFSRSALGFEGYGLASCLVKKCIGYISKVVVLNSKTWPQKREN